MANSAMNCVNKREDIDPFLFCTYESVLRIFIQRHFYIGDFHFEINLFLNKIGFM